MVSLLRSLSTAFSRCPSRVAPAVRPHFSPSVTSVARTHLTPSLPQSSVSLVHRMNLRPPVSLTGKVSSRTLCTECRAPEPVKKTETPQPLFRRKNLLPPPPALPQRETFHRQFPTDAKMGLALDDYFSEYLSIYRKRYPHSVRFEDRLQEINYWCLAEEVSYTISLREEMYELDDDALIVAISEVVKELIGEKKELAYLLRPEFAEDLKFIEQGVFYCLARTELDSYAVPILHGDSALPPLVFFGHPILKEKISMRPQESIFPWLEESFDLHLEYCQFRSLSKLDRPHPLQKDDYLRVAESVCYELITRVIRNSMSEEDFYKEVGVILEEEIEFYPQRRYLNLDEFSADKKFIHDLIFSCLTVP